MAEPVASLPLPSQKADPIPWPAATRVLAVPESGPAAKVTTIVHDAAERVRIGTQRSWDETQRTFRKIISNADAKMRYWRRERPLYIIAGVAATAAVLGVAVRLWRSRDE
jgi:hypothetical protein